MYDSSRSNNNDVSQELHKYYISLVNDGIKEESYIYRIDENSYIKSFTIENYLNDYTQNQLTKIYGQNFSDASIDLSLRVNHNGETTISVSINDSHIGFLKNDSNIAFHYGDTYKYIAFDFSILTYINNNGGTTYFPRIIICFYSLFVSEPTKQLLDTYIHTQKVIDKILPCPNDYYIECDKCRHINPFFRDSCEKCGRTFYNIKGASYSDYLSFQTSISEELQKDLFKKEKANKALENHNNYLGEKLNKNHKVITSLLITIVFLLIASIIVVAVSINYASSVEDKYSGVVHSYYLVDYTQVVSAGGTAKISIVGEPNTTHRITVKYSSGKSEADGLYAKTSDEDGNISWVWTVGGNTHSGTYPIIISDGTNKLVVYFRVI